MNLALRPATHEALQRFRLRRQKLLQFRAALCAAALALAAEILEGAPLSVQAARETVMLSTEMGRSAALQAARHASVTCYRSDDAQEGPLAFSEKRRPNWQGK